MSFQESASGSSCFSYFLSFSFSVQTVHVDLDMLILSFGEISETSMVCNAQFCFVVFCLTARLFTLRQTLHCIIRRSFEGVTCTFSALSLFAFIYLVYFTMIWDI